MKPDKELYYAIAVRRPNADLASVPDGVATGHNEQQRTRFPAGVVEVYANEAARDAALGPAGEGVEFVAYDGGEASLEEAELAVGHLVGQEGFEEALAVVADGLAPRLALIGPHRIISNRMVYGVDHAGQPLGASRVTPDTPHSEALILATSCAIWRALGDRVPSEQSEETNRAKRATSRRKNART